MKIKLSTGHEISINTDVLDQGLKDYEHFLHTMVTESMKKLEDADVSLEQLLQFIQNPMWDEIEKIGDTQIENHFTFLKYMLIFACTRDYHSLLKQAQETH